MPTYHLPSTQPSLSSDDVGGEVVDEMSCDGKRRRILGDGLVSHVHPHTPHHLGNSPPPSASYLMMGDQIYHLPPHLHGIGQRRRGMGRSLEAWERSIERKERIKKHISHSITSQISKTSKVRTSG